MAINILAGTARGISFVWGDLKLLGKVMKKNKVKSATMILAPFPIAIAAGALIIREYRMLRKERRSDSNQKDKEPKKMEPV